MFYGYKNNTNEEELMKNRNPLLNASFQCFLIIVSFIASYIINLVIAVSETLIMTIGQAHLSNNVTRAFLSHFKHLCLVQIIIFFLILLALNLLFGAVWKKIHPKNL